ncbi:MAG TPA: DUF1800 domain-containing protein [Pyrinomonadaceae bacterium]|nr:DUF1800 domain-containing protein [Pyrinomonadaceae bacterium]
MTYLDSKSHLSSRLMRPAIALFIVVTFVCGSLLNAADAQRTNVPRLNEDQRILHVLNRLGFGARPDDLQRVKRIGLEQYINQQLAPEKINDEAAEAKLKNLSTLNMSTAELYEKFPQPGQLLRQLERRGDLPAGLAAARDNRAQAQATAPGGAAGTGDAKTGNATAMNGEANGTAKTQMDALAGNNPAANSNPMDNEKYRQAVREYYMQNGLQLPQRITSELQASRILRAVYSERQLQEVMVDFWTNHFNVFAGKGADRWLLVSYDRDTIRPHAMGSFSDLLLATAQSPAMLFYLDNFQSVSPNAPAGPGYFGNQRPGAQRNPLAQLMRGGAQNRPAPSMTNNPQQQRPQQQARRGINENYARELMELHTLGVDGGYTQKDVQEVARCFTGWTIFAPRGGGAAAQAMMNGPRADVLRENAGRFFFNPRVHDDGEKTVLSHKIPAGGGIKDGLTVLDILAHQPATAKFIATKLVRHFVSDNPPPALVDRVAATFLKSNGDIRETLRAIFFSPEFNSPEAYRAKVKRPFELAISAVRTLGGETNGGPGLHQWIARMGEPLYGFQTPNGYSDAAESWVNTGGLLERLNFGLTLASNRIPGTRVDLKRFLDGNSLAKSDNSQMLARFLSLIVAGDMSTKTKATLLKQINDQTALVVPAAIPSRPEMNDAAQGEMMDRRPARQQQQQLARVDANITDPVTKLVGLILGSPEFQRQ